MANFNKVILIGNLTRDPQLSYLPNQTPVVELGMAVNRRFKKQDGEQGEEVTFVDLRIFGRRAEVLNQYCKKGDPLMVEGRLHLDRWQDKDGGNRSKMVVMIENFEFIGGRGGSGGGGAGAYADDAGASEGGYGGGPPRSSAPRPPASTPGVSASGGYTSGGYTSGASTSGGASRPAPSNNPPPVMGGDEVEDIPF
ncbi:MAG: single-stranded DNA-binding protein [Phycisphaeraceae bacterium]